MGAVIRAYVPVETPAGLVVALPPCEVCDPDSGGLIQRRWPDGGYTVWPCFDCSLTDVFDLVVPCPTCEGAGVLGVDFRPCDVIPCHGCAKTGWTPHGRYRVLDVLPIGLRGHHDTGVRPAVLIENAAARRKWLATVDGAYVELPDLPAAVPGGAALIVEHVTAAKSTSQILVPQEIVQDQALPQAIEETIRDSTER